MFNNFKKIWNNVRPIKYLHVAVDSGSRNKQTIVMLHGIAATSNTWNPLLAEMKTDKYRIIVLDLLGFGQSPRPNCEYDINDHMLYIRRTLKKIKVKMPFILVGHSMGAIISARYCNQYPREVKQAYLLSLPLYLDKQSDQTIFAHTATDIYFKAYEFLLANKKFTIKNSELIRKILNIADGIEVTEQNWDAFQLSLQNTIIHQNTFNDIKNCNVPMKIIYGNLDQFVIFESVNKLAQFKNVSITKLNAVDHAFSSRYAKYVAEFLQA